MVQGFALSILMLVASIDASETAAKKYTLSANWTELKGGWNTLRISLSDSHHSPLTGAAVSVVCEMEMPMEVPGEAVIEKGAGVYEKRLFLRMSGIWRFKISAKKEDEEERWEIFKNIPKDPTDHESYLIDANWSELKRGWNTLRIVVTDSKDKPVEGATVKLTYDMLTHPMHAPEKPVIEKGAGVYEKSVFLGMTGQWRFDFSVSQVGVVDTVRVIREISQRRRL